MATSEFKKYAKKKQWIHFPDEMIALFQAKNEKPLLKFLQKGFDVPADIKKLQARICFNADLVNRTASQGWHESLKILLENDCYINQDVEKNDPWDTLMWVLVCSGDHPKTVRTVVDYMLNQVYLVDEYIAYEICSNHPHIWPIVSDLFPKSVQEQSFGWALTGRSDHPEGDYEIILLSKLEQDLRRISKKDTVLKTKCFQQHIKGEYSKFKECDLSDIARWAVMGNFHEIFGVVDEAMNKNDPKRQGWVIDIYNQKIQHSGNAIVWYKWKRSKIQLSYLHNTDLARDIFNSMFPYKTDYLKYDANISSYVDAGVALWQRHHNWQMIERVRKLSAPLAEKILWEIEFNEFMQNHEGVFKYPHVCDILHQRWANVEGSTPFLTEILKKCTDVYQTSFALHTCAVNESAPNNTEETLKKLKEQQEALRKLKERQDAVGRPAGFIDTVMSGFANPSTKKKL